MERLPDLPPLDVQAPGELGDDDFSDNGSQQSCHCFDDFPTHSEEEHVEESQARKVKRKNERHPGEDPDIPSFSEYIASGVASKDPFCHVVSLLFEMMVDAGPEIFNDPQFFETCGTVVEDIPFTPAHEHELFEPSLRYIHSKLVVFASNSNLTAILNALADASRNGSWRLPLARTGILDFALEKVRYTGRTWNFEKRPSLRPRLRLIGNCIADIDENRAIVVKKLRDLKDLLFRAESEPEIIIGFSVLYNLLNDYPPAQTQPNQRLILELSASELSRYGHSPNARDSILQVLDFCNPDVNNSYGLPRILCNLAVNPQVVETQFYELAEVILSWLRPNLIAQEIYHSPSCFGPLLRVYLRTVGFVAPSASDSSVYPVDWSKDNHPPEDAEQMEQFRKRVLESIADFCTHDSFPVKHGVRDHSFWDMIPAWLETDEPGLETAACIILGNVLRGKGFWLSNMNKRRFQEGLIRLISKNQDSSLTFSALGCLRNSTLFFNDSNELVEYGIIPCLGKANFFEVSVLPQLLVTSLALIRVLVSHPLAVRDLLGGSVNKDRESHFWFPALMDIYNRNDMAEIKVEIARITTKMIKTICTTPEIRFPKGSRGDIHDNEDGDEDYRDIDSNSQESENPPVLDQTSKNFCQRRLAERSDDIKVVLTFLCSLKEHPAIRSEVIFTLALLARIEDPEHLFAQLAMDIVSSEAVHEFVDEILEVGRKEETDKSNHRDWENAMVMLTELKRNGHEVNDLMEKGWRGRRVITDDEIGGPRDP